MATTPYHRFSNVRIGNIPTPADLDNTVSTSDDFTVFNADNHYLEWDFPNLIDDSGTSQEFSEIIPSDNVITGLQYQFNFRTNISNPIEFQTYFTLVDGTAPYPTSNITTHTISNSGFVTIISDISLFGFTQLIPSNVDLLRFRIRYTDSGGGQQVRLYGRNFAYADGPSIALKVQYGEFTPPSPKPKITITGGTKVNIKKITQTSTDYSYATGYGAGGGVGFPQNTEYLLPENNGEVLFSAGVPIYTSTHYISLSNFDWENEIFPSNAVFDSITIKYSVKRQSATEIGPTKLIYRLIDDFNNIVDKLSVPFPSDDNYHNIEDTITSPNLSFNFFNNFQQIRFYWRNDLEDDDTGETANNDYDNGFLYINGNEGFDPQIKINYTIPSPTKVTLGF